MTTIINAASGTGLTQTADGSGVLKVQSNGVTTNALAWVNFNGTGTVAIRASYNVSSITDNGTGAYTVNFTTALSDANYSAVMNAGSSTITSSDTIRGLVPKVLSTTSVSMVNCRTDGVASDTDTALIAVFGN